MRLCGWHYRLVYMCVLCGDHLSLGPLDRRVVHSFPSFPTSLSPMVIPSIAVGVRASRTPAPSPNRPWIPASLYSYSPSESASCSSPLLPKASTRPSVVIRILIGNNNLGVVARYLCETFLNRGCRHHLSLSYRNRPPQSSTLPLPPFLALNVMSQMSNSGEVLACADHPSMALRRLFVRIPPMHVGAVVSTCGRARGG